MTRVIAVGNRKGGSGRISYVLNFAHSLQVQGISVLCDELDTQCNLTDVLIGGNAKPELTLFDALYDERPGTLGEIVLATDFSGVDLLPGNEALARVEVRASWLLKPD